MEKQPLIPIKMGTTLKKHIACVNAATAVEVYNQKFQSYEKKLASIKKMLWRIWVPVCILLSLTCGAWITNAKDYTYDADINFLVACIMIVYAVVMPWAGYDVFRPWPPNTDIAEYAGEYATKDDYMRFESLGIRPWTKHVAEVVELYNAAASFLNTGVSKLPVCVQPQLQQDCITQLTQIREQLTEIVNSYELAATGHSPREQTLQLIEKKLATPEFKLIAPVQQTQ